MGRVDGARMIAWLASLPPGARDAAFEERFGLAADLASVACPGEHLLGYHASGVSPVVRALVDAPVTAEDVLVDLGSGLGKVVLLAHLLTGARAHGVEIQPALVARAREVARELGADVTFACADAREADLEGTVFFLYLPFTGPVLEGVMRRLHAIARRRPIVVCALGVDLDRVAPWLARRPGEAFWLALYDSVIPGVPARVAARSPLAGPLAEAIAFERAVRL